MTKQLSVRAIKINLRNITKRMADEWEIYPRVSFHNGGGSHGNDKAIRYGERASGHSNIWQHTKWRMGYRPSTRPEPSGMTRSGQRSCTSCSARI